MEVSGQRLTVVTICEPCQTENLSKQADGFCAECKEYMCQVCFLHHLKAKSCRNHVLNPVNTGSYDRELQIREEKCKKHVEETIKYYCRNHDSVVCGDCLVSDHPMCEPKFIRDIANNVETSSEFKDLQSRMPKWEADKAEGEMRVERNRIENKALLDNALQKLRTSREEVNVWLDKMEENIKAEVRKISNDNEVLLSEVEKNFQAVSDDIDKIKAKMDTNLYQCETLFINMVECKPKLGVIEAILSDIKTNNKIRAYAFEPEIKVHETSASSLRLGIIEVSSNMNKEETQPGSEDDYSDQFTGSSRSVMTLTSNEDEDSDSDKDFDDYLDSEDVEVEYDREAMESDELTIKRGDIITNVVKNKINEGWSEGELNGERGMFPSNYVKVIKRPKKDTNNDESAEDQTNKIQGQVLEGPSVICTTGSTSSVMTLTSNEDEDSDTDKDFDDNLDSEDVEVEYNYKAMESDELTIKKGDIIKNVNMGECWSEGELNGERGLFPTNYVKVIKRPKKDTNNDESVEDQMNNIQGPVLEGPSVICTTEDVEVIYDHKAWEPDELTIKIGDIITNVVEIDEGWSEGELNGERGIFPNNCVKVIKHPKKDTNNDGGKKKAQANNIQGQMLEEPSVICKTSTEDKPLHTAVIPRHMEQQTVTFNERETSRESVKLLKKLNRGLFGDIFSGKWRGSVDVAVKTMRDKKNTTADDFLHEAKILCQLNHERIIQLIAVCTKLKPIWIITELMVNGNLLEYLRKDKGKHVEFTQLTDMAGQIASGMAYLETMNCVHRNLQAAHILVENRNDVKIAHFHMAHFLQGEDCLSQPSAKMPVQWMAPEAAIGGKFSIKSDVWSYGVLLHELITFGQVPYPGIKNSDVITKVEQGYRMPQKTKWPLPCPDPYYEIMLLCWNKEADSRPTFEYLQDFFENYMVAREEMYD